MSQDTLHRNIGIAIILAESTHVFCCVLPTLVTIISIMASVGAIIPIPLFLLDIHEFLHEYELPVIAFSGAVLALGWGLYLASRVTVCEKPHCEPHETVCAGKKDRTRWVLAVATALFIVNITIYFTLHRGNEDLLPHGHAHEQHHEHDH